MTHIRLKISYSGNSWYSYKLSFERIRLKSELCIFNLMKVDNVTFEIYWFTCKNLLFYSVIFVVISEIEVNGLKKLTCLLSKEDYKTFYC